MFVTKSKYLFLKDEYDRALRELYEYRDFVDQFTRTIESDGTIKLADQDIVIMKRSALELIVQESSDRKDEIMALKAERDWYKTKYADLLMANQGGLV